jgi:hypothetical protein
MTDRSKLAKCIGMIGSTHDGERSNALAAADKALADASLNWTRLAEMVDGVSQLERRVQELEDLHDPARDTLFGRLLVDRLGDGLVHAWSIGDGEANFVRGVSGAILETGPLSVDVADMTRAIGIADEAQRRGGSLARRTA